jgi:hypothetical protein
MLLMGMPVGTTRFAGMLVVRIDAVDRRLATIFVPEMTPAATYEGVRPEANCGDNGNDETHDKSLLLANGIIVQS